jgi:lipoate-protein ligase A
MFLVSTKNQYRQGKNMRQWRVIYESKFNNGRRNMAIDGAILDAVSQGMQPPTLRLYGWQPMCLSIGYGQSIAEVDIDRLIDHGWHIVRRPTGGKAILHGDELTYSVSVPIDHDLASGDVVESYRRISRGLLRALHYIGLSPQSEHQGDGLRDKTKSPVCFEVPSHYEITVDTRKLLGSAQVRRKDGILQHGTLPLYGDVARICDALLFETSADREQAKIKVHSRAVTLADVMTQPPSWEQASQAVERGFSETFDLEMVRGDLSAWEIQRADELLLEQFDNPDWTNKR